MLDSAAMSSPSAWATPWDAEAAQAPKEILQPKVAKATYVAGGAMSYPSLNRAISHFIQRKKHYPLFLASFLRYPSESHEAAGEGLNGKLEENRP